MLYPQEKIIFAILAILCIIISWMTFSAMFKIIRRGQGRLHFENLPSRIGEALNVLITQKTVLKNRPVISFIHALIAWAFILYFLVNIGDVLQGYIAGFHFLGKGIIGNLYRLFVDIFSVLALLATAFFLVRRFIYGSIRLKFNDNIMIGKQAISGMRVDSLIVGFFIILHVGFRFIGESFTLQMNGADAWQPLATQLSAVWQGLEHPALTFLQHTFWWIALGLILLFIPYFPASKHIHLIMGPVNYLTRPRRSSPGTLERLDFENDDIEQFGVSKLEHLDQTLILDAYACIMCNRCQDVCPAYVTGKELSPSAMEINKRYYIKENTKTLAKGEESGSEMLQYALSESAVWACTSCAACVEICPVGNEPMYDILNIRRDRVLMESQFPRQLQGAFNGMERNQNPWNINEDRLKWAKEDETITIKTVEDNPDFDILYWVGCAGAFDQKGQEIARAFTKILNAAGVNFAVLGNKEGCTGDSARRAGNEYLFSMMAESNVETLNAARVTKIVATCPHCLHTLQNEYPQFGGNYEVVHHTQFINELLAAGRLKFKPGQEKIAFHDPCYLGRHNGIFDAPRSGLKKVNYNVVELENNKSNSFCCGAGGAQMWKEEEEGKEPVRQRRIKEAIDVKPDALCTACPFCLTMLRDASNELDSGLQVKDIAVLVAEKIDA